MIERDTTKDIEEAKKEAKEQGVLRNSFTRGERTVSSILAEIMFCEYSGAKREPTYDYDCILNGKKIDVKSKECSSVPMSIYEVGVPVSQENQKCDIYAFCRIYKNLEKGWILGFMSKKEYFENAYFCEAGQIDNNGMKYKAPSWNMRIGKLHDIKNLKEAGINLVEPKPPSLKHYEGWCEEVCMLYGIQKDSCEVRTPCPKKIKEEKCIIELS